MPAPSATLASTESVWKRAFPAVAGIWLTVLLVKLGNPVILDTQIERPQNILEWIYSAWPIAAGYLCLGLALLAALPAWRWKWPRPKWLTLLPLVWFCWQLLSATQSVRPDLSSATLWHFGACITCFYIGLFALSQVRQLRPFWLGLVLGLFVVLWVGFDQQLRSLEQTRRAYAEMTNHWDQVSPKLRKKLDTPEFRQKISSNRIFSTFVYPNAFAGAILLLLPPSLAVLLHLTTGCSLGLRVILICLIALAGLACLYWSQSKAGWLICLGLGLVTFLHLPLAPRLKWGIAGLVLCAGLAGFFLKYSGYFAQGAKSAEARRDYWSAAWQLTQEKPFVGAGPGTFMVGYKRLKRPESEMTRLTHNDYLQQGADSGWPGLLLYSTFIWGSVGLLYRRIQRHHPEPAKTGLTGAIHTANLLPFAVWLGLAGFAAQSMVEFGLYIPALAWPFFLLLGWLWGTQNQIDNRQPAR